MAKQDITLVTASDTFQLWLDKTNELVDLMNTDVMTASITGDTTIGNATLTGTFNAIDLVSNTSITNSLATKSIVNTLNPVDFVAFDSPISVTSTQEKLLVLTSSSQKPAINLINSGNANWNVTLGTITSTTPFVIETEGTTTPQFTLMQNGNLTLSGSLTATTLIGTLDGRATSLTGLAATIIELNRVAGISSNIQDQLNLKAPIAAPTFTGIPSAPTAAVGTNTTQIATTAFIQSTIANGINATTSNTAAALSANYITDITTTPETSGITVSPTTASSAKTAVISMSGTYTGNLVITGGISTLGANGNIVASQNVTAYSDERLKSNVRTIDNALDKVSLMRGVYFDKNETASTGVIAQEMEKVLPEVVFDGEYKSVAYGNIVGILIEAIKELKNEIELLKQKNI